MVWNFLRRKSSKKSSRKKDLDNIPSSSPSPRGDGETLRRPSFGSAMSFTHRRDLHGNRDPAPEEVKSKVSFARKYQPTVHTGLVASPYPSPRHSEIIEEAVGAMSDDDLESWVGSPRTPLSEGMGSRSNSIHKPFFRSASGLPPVPGKLPHRTSQVNTPRAGDEKNRLQIEARWENGSPSAKDVELARRQLQRPYPPPSEFLVESNPASENTSSVNVSKRDRRQPSILKTEFYQECISEPPRFEQTCASPLAHSTLQRGYTLTKHDQGHISPRGTPPATKVLEASNNHTRKGSELEQDDIERCNTDISTHPLHNQKQKAGRRKMGAHDDEFKSPVVAELQGVGAGSQPVTCCATLPSCQASGDAIHVNGDSRWNVPSHPIKSQLARQPQWINHNAPRAVSLSGQFPLCNGMISSTSLVPPTLRGRQTHSQPTLRGETRGILHNTSTGSHQYNSSIPSGINDPQLPSERLCHISVVSRAGGGCKLYKITLKGEVRLLSVTNLKKALHVYTNYPVDDMCLTKDGRVMHDFMYGADVDMQPGSVVTLSLMSEMDDFEHNRVLQQTTIGVSEQREEGSISNTRCSMSLGTSGNAAVSWGNRFSRNASLAADGRQECGAISPSEFSSWSPNAQAAYLLEAKGALDAQIQRMNTLHYLWARHHSIQGEEHTLTDTSGPRVTSESTVRRTASLSVYAR